MILFWLLADRRQFILHYNNNYVYKYHNDDHDINENIQYHIYLFALLIIPWSCSPRSLIVDIPDMRFLRHTQLVTSVLQGSLAIRYEMLKICHNIFIQLQYRRQTPDRPAHNQAKPKTSKAAAYKGLANYEKFCHKKKIYLAIER